MEIVPGGIVAAPSPNPLDDVLIRLVADFAEDGSFGHRTLEVTKEIVRVLGPGDAPSFVIPVSDIRSARNEPLVGGGRLEIITQKGDLVPVVSYSLTVSAKFSEAARGIEQLAKDEPLLINLKEEKLRCGKCNRLLPEKDGICPACVNRGKTMLRIAKFMYPYRDRAMLLALMSLVTTLLNLCPPLIQGKLIDTVLKNHRDLYVLWQLMLCWLGVLVVNSILQIASGRYIAFLAGYIASDLRSAVYRAIEFLQLTFFDKIVIFSRYCVFEGDVP